MKNKLLTLTILLTIILIFSACSNQKSEVEDIKIKKYTSNEKNETLFDDEESNRFSTATLLAVGDVMFHNTQVYAAYNYKTKSYNFDDTFKYVKEYILDSDIAIANFETVTAGSEHGYKGYPTFNSPSETIKALKNAGFDIINTANNHSLDKGKEGIIETIENIKKYGLINIGTYTNRNSDILIKNINGIRIAFLSYTYGCNGLEVLVSKDALDYMVSLIEKNKIEQEIKHADNVSDVVVVYIHWGNEYKRVPNDYQIDLAKNMFKWGADIIFGSHPHVIQKSEIINHDGEEKFIIYSLGNFVSDQRRETLRNIKNREFTEDGVIVKLKLEKDLVKNKVSIKDVDYIPTWVNKYKINGRNKYEILPVKDFIEDKNLDNVILEKLKKSYINTMNLMDKK